MENMREHVLFYEKSSFVLPLHYLRAALYAKNKYVLKGALCEILTFSMCCLSSTA